MQQAQVEEQRQKEANETALAAIGKPKKRKIEESTNYSHPTLTVSNGPEQISPVQPSPSANVVQSTNQNSKSVCLFRSIETKRIELDLFSRNPLNVYVVQICAIYYQSWNEINILNEQHFLLKLLINDFLFLTKINRTWILSFSLPVFRMVLHANYFKVLCNFLLYMSLCS